MRMTKCFVALIILLFICVPCAAQESTAYMLRYEDGPLTELVKVTLPPEYHPDLVEPMVVGRLGMGWVSSMALSPSGELLALDYDGDRLLEIDMATGAASSYVDLDLDIERDSGIAFDEAGQAWLMNTDIGCFLYHLNTQTGETSLVVQLEDSVSVIAVHNGTIYAGWGPRFCEVDTTTGELTVLMEFWENYFLTALHSDHSDLWGVLFRWQGPACLGPTLERFFPMETVMRIAIDFDSCEPIPFALIVVTQPPPTAIPAMTTPGLIAFAFLLAGAGFLIVRSRFAG